MSSLNGYIELIEFRGRTVLLHLCIWRAVGLYLGIALGPLILPSGNWVSLSAPLFYRVEIGYRSRPLIFTEWFLGIALGPFVFVGLGAFDGGCCAKGNLLLHPGVPAEWGI